MLKRSSIISAAIVTLITSTTISCKYKVGQQSGSVSATSGVTVMACDESFQRIMEQEISVFEYQYPNASILTHFIPEQQCIDSLLYTNNTKLAVTSRPLTSSEMRYLELRKRQPRSKMIAVDAIAIIANPENPIREISTSDLAKILSGEITEWRWVEPGNKSGKIEVIFDYNGSSTIRYMTDSIMNGQEFGKNVFAQNSNAKVVQTVSENKGAIGIIGVSWISSDMKGVEMTTEELSEASNKNDTTMLGFSPNINVLAVTGPNQFPGEGKKPYQAYIFDGSYPLYRPIYLTVTGYKNATQSGFFTFVTGFSGQKLIQLTGVLPAAMHPRIVNVE